MARETGGNTADNNRFDTSRRRFLGSSGLAAIGAVIGGVVPLSRDGAGIPQAHAQAASPAAAKGPQHLKFPGKNDKPRRARRPAAGGRDAGEPARRRHHADRQVLHPQQRADSGAEAKDPDAWKIAIDGEVNKKLEITLGELKNEFQPVTRRMVLECGGNGRSFFTPQARGNQWTNGGAGCAEWTGVRAGRRAEGGGRQAVGGLHRALRRRPASVRRRHQGQRSRAACRIEKAMDRTT